MNLVNDYMQMGNTHLQSVAPKVYYGTLSPCQQLINGATKSEKANLGFLALLLNKLENFYDSDTLFLFSYSTRLNILIKSLNPQ